MGTFCILEIHIWIWSLGKRSELEVKYTGFTNMVYKAWGIEYSEVGSEWD